MEKKRIWEKMNAIYVYKVNKSVNRKATYQKIGDGEAVERERKGVRQTELESGGVESLKREAFEVRALAIGGIGKNYEEKESGQSFSVKIKNSRLYYSIQSFFSGLKC